MISKNDLEIYDELFLNKSLSEKYLGYVAFDWVFSSIRYHADCTLAIQFDLFDKIIVKILLIDDVLSIEQLGEILGMNLTHNPANLQYKDEAEYDILRSALDNLNAYNMIEIGDTAYSSCTLTKDGRTFAEKGYKFKVDENRPFNLFYDHITNIHLEAKKELEHLKGKTIKLIENFDFLDEAILYDIAEAQVPEIHNPLLGNSFINTRIDYINSNSYTLTIAVALLFDVITKQVRLIAFEPSSKKTNYYFTQFINRQRLEFIGLFSKTTEAGVLIDNETSYLTEVSESKIKIESLITTLPSEAIEVNKVSNSECTYIDSEFFWLNLELFFYDPINELFLLVSDVTDIVLAKIRALARSENSPIMFVIFKQSENEVVNNKIRELYQLSTNEQNRLYIAVYSEVAEFDCFFKSKKRSYSLKEELLLFKSEEGCFSKYFLRNIPKLENDIPSVYSQIKKTIADDYLNVIEKDVDEFFANKLEKELVTKKIILDQYNVTKKAAAFSGADLSEGSQERLVRINQKLDERISELKQQHIQTLSDRIATLSQQFEEVQSDKLEDILLIANDLLVVEKEYFDEYSELKIIADNLQKKLNSEIKRIKDDVLSKTYIIDTNVFIKEPDIISKIDLTKHYVALSLSVIEELDKLKMQPDNKANAEKAIRNINTLLITTKMVKRSRVRRQSADLTLLPLELQKKSSDNMILSLGLVYKKQNPVIVTLDRNFQSKAIILDIPLITIYELLGIKEEVRQKRIPLKASEPDYKTIFQRMKSDKNGDYLIKDFVALVRKDDPTFDYKKLGFENVFKFILSLRIFKIYKSKFLKLK